MTLLWLIDSLYQAQLVSVCWSCVVFFYSNIRKYSKYQLVSLTLSSMKLIPRTLWCQQIVLLCQSHHKSGIVLLCHAQPAECRDLLKNPELFTKRRRKKKLLYIYLNNNIKFLKSALFPAGMGSVLSCSLIVHWNSDTGGALEVMESHGCGDSWFHSLWNAKLQSYVHIHKCPGNRGASDRAWNCLSPTSLGSKPRTKDCELSTDKNHGAAVESRASTELSPTALLFSQTCRSECWGGKKKI